MEFAKSGLRPLDANVVWHNGIRASCEESRDPTSEKFNLRSQHLLLSVKRNRPPDVRTRGDDVYTTNGIKLTRRDVIKVTEMVEGSAREKRKRVTKENVMPFKYESIEKQIKCKDFMEIQLSRALERSRQYIEKVWVSRLFSKRRLEMRRIKRRKEDDRDCGYGIF